MASGRLPVWAVPFWCRIPAISLRTARWAVGVSRPAAWFAWEMAERRRVRVKTLAVSASVDKYRTTVSGAAGRFPCPAVRHQAEKCFQSEALARRVFSGVGDQWNGKPGEGYRVTEWLALDAARYRQSLDRGGGRRFKFRAGGFCPPGIRVAAARVPRIRSHRRCTAGRACPPGRWRS